MPSQIILFSQPRTGCHFLERMVFSKQPNLARSWHPLTATSQLSPMINTWLQEQDGTDLLSKEFSNLRLEAQKGVQIWRDALGNVENHVHYVHEHPCFFFTPERTIEVLMSRTGQPPSPLRDEHLQVPPRILLHPRTVPVFTIRHPVLQVPSSYKAVNTLFSNTSALNHAFATNVIWTRDLYDWYLQHGIKPVVLDADDYMSNQDFVRHVAAQVGLDPQAAIVEWPAMSEKEKSEMHPMLVQIQESLLTSTGPVPERSGKYRDLNAERKCWREKYSTDEVELLEGLVQAAMPHYEYLRERKLRL